MPVSIAAQAGPDIEMESLRPRIEYEPDWASDSSVGMLAWHRALGMVPSSPSNRTLGVKPGDPNTGRGRIAASFDG